MIGYARVSREEQNPQYQHDALAAAGCTARIVWRDTRRAAVGTQGCGTAPDWAPLGEMQLVAFDE